MSQTTLAETPVSRVPAAPANLTATVVSGIQIDLSWQDRAADETSFQIERGTGNGEFTPIATVDANVTRHSDTDLQPSTTYTYRVRATNAAGNSAGSNVVSRATFADAPVSMVPTPPTDLKATVISTSEIDLSWRDTADNETGFQIERRIGSGEFTGIATVGANVTNRRDTNLQPDTSYTYRVRATNATGNSDWSDAVTQITSQTRPIVQIDLTATVVSSSRIDLIWQAGPSDSTAFEIERKTENGIFTLITTVDADAKRYSDTVLEPGTGYTYRVRAINEVGNSDWSNPVTLATPSTTPIVQILLTATVISGTQINLSWQASSGSGADFDLERRIEDGTFTQIATVDADMTDYRDTGLRPGTRYTYRIRAILDGGDAGVSNQVTLTSVSSPLPPTNLTFTLISSTRIALSWQDNSGNESGFEIERKVGDDRFFRPIVTLGVDATRHIDTTLQPDTVYTYRVSAVNAAGDSEPSNTVVFDPSLVGKPAFELAVPAGIGFVHIPLAVAAVNGQPMQMRTISALYDALGPENVNLIITYDSRARRWRSFFGEASRGTLADATITDDAGLITMIKRDVMLRLTGDGLGRNGASQIVLRPGNNLVGVPLRDDRLKRVSDFFNLEGIGGNAREIIVVDGGRFKAVRQPGDDGDLPITGGQAFIITAGEASLAEVTGVAWGSASGSAAVAPSIASIGPVGSWRAEPVYGQTPVLAVHGAAIDGARVTVKNLSNGGRLKSVCSDGHYSMTFVDLASKPARWMGVGDILEITAETSVAFIGVHPQRHVVSIDDVTRGWVHLPDLITYEIPTETKLLPNYPNPFNPETWIPYRLAEDGFVALTIYDVEGGIVCALKVGNQPAGVYESKRNAIHWDGRNDFGERAASGVYFYTLTANDFTATRKMLILK